MAPRCDLPAGALATVGVTTLCLTAVDVRPHIGRALRPEGAHAHASGPARESAPEVGWGFRRGIRVVSG